MHISVDAVNVMAAYQPVVLTCVHCGGNFVNFSKSPYFYFMDVNTFFFFSEQRSVSFARLSKRSMAQKKLRTPRFNRNQYQGDFLGGKARPALRADYSAVPVVPNVKVRIETQHSTPPPT